MQTAEGKDWLPPRSLQNTVLQLHGHAFTVSTVLWAPKHKVVASLLCMVSRNYVLVKWKAVRISEMHLKYSLVKNRAWNVSHERVTEVVVD